MQEQSTFAGFGGLPLFYRSWRPLGPRAALVLVHGLGDHSGLYPLLVEHTTGWGAAVYAFDLRGNGRSPGRRAYIGSWREFREDLAAFVRLVRGREPALPLFLLGNSLGGLIVLDYALERPAEVRGVIAASTPLGPLGVPPVRLWLARAASRVWPGFTLETGMDLGGLSRDATAIEEVLRDPLFHRKGTARLATEVLATIDRVRREAPRFPLPVLLLHGGADRMVPPRGARELFERLGGPDKEYREYPGAYHALFADLDADRVLTDLERWMERRVEAGRPDKAGDPGGA